MIAPLPNWRSIWLTAASSACSRSIGLHLSGRATAVRGRVCVRLGRPARRRRTRVRCGYARRPAGRGTSPRTSRFRHELATDQVQRRGGGTCADSARRPAAPAGAPARPPATPGAGTRDRPACPRRAAAGPCDPGHRDRDVGPQPLPRPGRHRRGGLGADGAETLDHPPGHPQHRGLGCVGIGDRRRRRTPPSCRGRRSACPPPCPRCTTRPPPASSPRARARSSTMPPIDRSSSANTCSPSSRRRPRRELVRRPARRPHRPGCRSRSRSCARRSRSRPPADRLPAIRTDRRRATPRSRRCVSSGVRGAGRGRTARPGPGASARAPTAAAAPRERPAGSRPCAPPIRATSAGRGAGDAEHRRPREDLRLLAVAGGEPVGSIPAAGRDPVGPVVILSSTSASSTSSTPAAFPIASTVRSSWVGPRPPEVTSRSAPSSATRRPSPISSMPSPTVTVRSIRKPCSSRLRARWLALRSAITPRRSSFPVSRMAAAGRVKLGRRPRG